MLKKISIEFDGTDKNGLTELQEDELNKILSAAIAKMEKHASVKKVTVDNNVFYLRITKGGGKDATL